MTEAPELYMLLGRLKVKKDLIKDGYIKSTKKDHIETLDDVIDVIENLKNK